MSSESENKNSKFIGEDTPLLSEEVAQLRQENNLIKQRLAILEQSVPTSSLLKQELESRRVEIEEIDRERSALEDNPQYEEFQLRFCAMLRIAQGMSSPNAPQTNLIKDDIVSTTIKLLPFVGGIIAKNLSVAREDGGPIKKLFYLANEKSFSYLVDSLARNLMLDPRINDLLQDIDIKKLDLPILEAQQPETTGSKVIAADNKSLISSIEDVKLQLQEMTKLLATKEFQLVVKKDLKSDLERLSDFIKELPSKLSTAHDNHYLEILLKYQLTPYLQDNLNELKKRKADHEKSHDDTLGTDIETGSIIILESIHKKLITACSYPAGLEGRMTDSRFKESPQVSYLLTSLMSVIISQDITDKTPMNYQLVETLAKGVREDLEKRKTIEETKVTDFRHSVKHDILPTQSR